MAVTDEVLTMNSSDKDLESAAAAATWSVVNSDASSSSGADHVQHDPLAITARVSTTCAHLYVHSLRTLRNAHEDFD